MKMPSTYISLLLLGGFIAIFCYTHQDTGLNTRPARIKPMAVNGKLAVKKILTAEDTGVYWCKEQNKHSDPEQAGRNEFSFFRDVIGNIAPALKY